MKITKYTLPMFIMFESQTTQEDSASLCQLPVSVPVLPHTFPTTLLEVLIYFQYENQYLLTLHSTEIFTMI